LHDALSSFVAITARTIVVVCALLQRIFSRCFGQQQANNRKITFLPLQLTPADLYPSGTPDGVINLPDMILPLQPAHN
jgi:hypothetical protein